MFVVALLLAGIALILDSGRGTGAPSERVNQLVFGSLGLATLALLLWFSQRVGPAREEELDSEATPLCPNCLVPHPEGMHFCATCGAPLTFFAGTAKYELVYAVTWMAGKAIHAPRLPMHFLVVLLWGAMTILQTVFILYGAVQSGASLSDWEGTLILWAQVGPMLLLVGWAILALRMIQLSARNLKIVRAQDEDAPARPIYGSPPYWTFDIQGKVAPQDEEQGDEVPDGA